MSCFFYMKVLFRTFKKFLNKKIMKLKGFLLSVCVVLSIWSCTQPEEKPLTAEDKAAIEKEITAMVDSIASSANELRTDYFKRTYWNNEQFVGIDLTGAKGFDSYMKETDEMYAQMKSINFMEDNVRVNVFDTQTAMVLFEGKAKGESKEGVIMNLSNFNASMLFRKIDGNWKVVYTHQSADQEIIMPADSTMTDSEKS